jgi:glycosyltransferase involved in cell wall biosynthesis
MSSETVLYMVIPCYNEQEVLPDSAEKLKNKITDLIVRKKISKQSKICFVNDGSRDRTWAIIRELCQQDPVYSGICLAHNEGHQNAVLAGLMTVQPYCDAAISMDADLQDDIDTIDAMIDKYDEGCNIVYGVRDNRETDTFFKRVTAEGFYRFMKMMGADVIFNHADFRLMDKQALAAFGEYQEVNLFLRGIVPMIGLKHDCVYYKRKERLAGESKYPLKKMFAFAWQGITSLSSKPIKFIVDKSIKELLSCLFIFIFLFLNYFEIVLINIEN